MTTTKQNKITDPETNFTEIETSEESKLQALQVFRADREKRKADPDPAISILAEIEAERAAIRIAEYESYPVHERAVRLADEWAAANVAELASLLRADLSERTKSKDGVLAGIGKKVSAISTAMFTSGADRDQLGADRQKAEDEAAVLESAIAIAVQEIRTFELAPSLHAYRSAAGCVSRISLPS